MVENLVEDSRKALHTAGLERQILIQQAATQYTRIGQGFRCLEEQADCRTGQFGIRIEKQ